MMARVLWLFFMFLFSIVLTNQVDYGGTSVYRVVPKDKAQVEALIQLQSGGVDFWKEPILNLEADIMALPKQKQYVEEFLKEHGLAYEIMIEDLGKLIEEESQTLNSSQPNQPMGKSLVAENLNSEAIPGFWNSYQRYNDIIAFLDALQAQNPDLAQKITFGTSYEGRNLDLIRIGSDLSVKTKPVVWIEGGIHAREWVSPSTASYFAQALINGFRDGKSDFVRVLNAFDFYVVPVLNADGYEYSHTTNRMWRKTRRLSEYVKKMLANETIDDDCYGTDPNRNFDYKWAEGGGHESSNPCMESFVGDHAFSEPEVRAEADYLLNQFELGQVKVFLAFHSYGQRWMYPWGYTREIVTPDNDELKAKAQIAVDALKQSYGTEYLVGLDSELYPAPGGSDDWAYGNASVKYSYTVELRDRSTFFLPPDQIIPTGIETTAAIVALVDAVRQTLGL